MEYDTSYDTGSKPFNHDKKRGKWTSSKDFLFVCAGHAFKVDTFMVLPLSVFLEIGIYSMSLYLIILAVCVVPIVFMQSFLGQFSSTGFISAFRICPLFKGIGYVSLVLNFATLTSYSIFSAIPLFYFFHTLTPTIPWSCEGAKQWMNSSQLRSSICTKEVIQSENFYDDFRIPSVEFFRNYIDLPTRFDDVETNTFSGQIMLCSCIIWGILAFIISKPTEFIGRFVRYSFLTVTGIMCLCCLRLIFLPGAIEGLWKSMLPPTNHIYYDTWMFLPAMALTTLGPGWGSILTMASYNNFKTNIFRYSWVMSLIQLGVMFGVVLLSMILRNFMESTRSDSYGHIEYQNEQWKEFLSIPTGLTYLEWPHVWSLLFFTMWILGSLNLLAVQLLSLLTSLFDEFEYLREIKRKTIFGAVGVFSVTSLFFCSSLGLNFMRILTKYSLITQAVLNMLLLLVVLWIYGRERFQRDLNFMTSRVYPTWMVYIVRFIAPIVLFYGLLIGFVISVESEHSPALGGLTVYIIATLIFLLPWFMIPGYCILKLKQTTGIIRMRLRKCVRPKDWYPADPLYKQGYEESLNIAPTSQISTLTTEGEALHTGINA